MLQHLKQNDYAMICWLCRVNSSDKTKIGILLAKLGLCDFGVVECEHRLGWFGLVTQFSGEINRIQNMRVSGQRGPLRDWKTWTQCVTKYLKYCGSTKKLAHDRYQWRSSVRNYRLEPTSREAVHIDPSPQSGNRHPQDGNMHRLRGMCAHSSIK